METSVKVEGAATASPPVSALMRNLIDYAGLFPPASLAMSPAVANYAKYARSEFNWMLGRFIVPAARLGEFLKSAGKLEIAPADNARRWHLSALLGPDVASDFARVSESNARCDSKHHNGAPPPPIEASVESIEAKVASPAEIETFSKIICPEMETYFEIPWSTETSRNLLDWVEAVAACGRRAKIRTGGETADKIPPSEVVVEFIKACSNASVPFKATAGLHHPLRSKHRLTYQPETPSGVMHGFLNVFLAAVFVRQGIDSPPAVELLNEQNLDAFEFDSTGVTWRGNRLSYEQIAEARDNFAVAFGSCSFTEPIEDLRSLHLL